MNAVKVLNFWIHLVAGFSYVGGLIFISLFLSPVAKKYSQDAGFRFFLEELHDRFQKWSGLFIALILITGGINIHFAHVARGDFSIPYFVALTFKILFFSVILTHYLLTLKLIIGREQKKGLSEIPFKQPTFILGILILIMAAFLKHLP
jgi:uncharacterized membrane protein